MKQNADSDDTQGSEKPAGWTDGQNADSVPVVIVHDGVTYNCSGYRDERGILTHDGFTCPIHEDPDSGVYVSADYLTEQNDGSSRQEPS